LANLIVSCHIGASDGGFCHPVPGVHATFADGTTKTLFTFYPDELSFAEAEFLGLTEEEAMQLYMEKDLAYLRS
jgi:hypothetical protein